MRYVGLMWMLRLSATSIKRTRLRRRHPHDAARHAAENRSSLGRDVIYHPAPRMYACRLRGENILLASVVSPGDKSLSKRPTTRDFCLAFLFVWTVHRPLYVCNQPPNDNSSPSVSIPQVCDEQRCEEQVFPLAINYMDRFLCLCPIAKNQFQLLGAVCLLLATKIRQCYALTADLLCAYTEYSVTPDEIRVSDDFN